MQIYFPILSRKWITEVPLAFKKHKHIYICVYIYIRWVLGPVGVAHKYIYIYLYICIYNYICNIVIYRGHVTFFKQPTCRLLRPHLAHLGHLLRPGPSRRARRGAPSRRCRWWNRPAAPSAATLDTPKPTWRLWSPWRTGLVEVRTMSLRGRREVSSRTSRPAAEQNIAQCNTFSDNTVPLTWDVQEA